MTFTVQWIPWLQAFSAVATGTSIVLLFVSIRRAAMHGWKRPYYVPVLFLVGAMIACVNMAVLGPSAMAGVLPRNSMELEGNTTEVIWAMEGTHLSLLQGLQGIETRNRLPPSAWKDEDSVGVYYPTERRIYILNGYVNPYVVQHELHHDIWYYRLTDEEREEFTRIHQASHSPTEYGETSVEEDFADSGAIFITHTPGFARLNEQRFTFLQRVYARMLNITLYEDEHGYR